MRPKRSLLAGTGSWRWLLCLALPAATACSHAHTELYVSAEDGGEVLVIDADRGEVTARIPVGKRPRGMKLSRDGKLLYVALSGSPRGGPGVDESKLPPPDRSADGIGVVDLASKKLVRTLPSGQDPEAFDLSLDDKTLFVSNEETAEMSVVDLTTGQVRAKVPVGHEPEGVSVRPDGKVVYVTAEADNAVFAVDTSALKVLAQIPTGPRPRAVAFSKDGATGFVTCENGGVVTVFDTAKNAVTGSVTIAPKAENGPRPADGRRRRARRPHALRLDRPHRIRRRHRRRLATPDAAVRRRGRAALGRRREPRRQARVHRERAVERRLGDRHRDRRGRKADRGGAPAVGHRRRGGALRLREQARLYGRAPHMAVLPAASPDTSKIEQSCGASPHGSSPIK